MTRRPFPDHPVERSLLEAVLATPQDDAPRLVYADFLAENGQPDRGELIVVQCERERLEREGLAPSDAYRALCRREQKLLSGQARRMAKAVGFDENQTKITRGFVTEISAPLDQVRARWGVLVASPLEHLFLFAFEEDDLRWLARRPTLERIARVTLRAHVAWELGGAALARTTLPDGQLFDPQRLLPPSPLADAIRGVDQYLWVVPTALEELKRHTPLRRLGLHVRDVESVVELIRHPIFAPVEAFMLTAGVEKEHLRALAENGGNLRELALVSFNGLEAGLIPPLPNLERLYLGGFRINTTFDAFPKLFDLRMRSGSMAPGIAEIVHAKWPPFVLWEP